MYNFVMIFKDTNIPPNKVTLEIKDTTMALAQTKALAVLGTDTKGNPYVFERPLTIQQIPEIETDNE